MLLCRGIHIYRCAKHYLEVAKLIPLPSSRCGSPFTVSSCDLKIARYRYVHRPISSSSTPARPTRPLVPPSPISRSILPLRPRSSPPTLPSDIRPPPRLSRSRREPLLPRPGAPLLRARLHVDRREFDARRCRSRFHRRVDAVGESVYGAYESDGGGSHHLLDGGVWVRHAQ